MLALDLTTQSTMPGPILGILLNFVHHLEKEFLASAALDRPGGFDHGRHFVMGERKHGASPVQFLNPGLPIWRCSAIGSASYLDRPSACSRSRISALSRAAVTRAERLAALA